MHVNCVVTLPQLPADTECTLVLVTVIQPFARRVVKVKVAILGSWSLTVLTVSVDREQQ